MAKFFNPRNTKPTHAGGIVFREKNGTKEFLLISTKNFLFTWVLPKGHIKSSETEAEAAIREVKEESGMKVSIVSRIGNAERWKWNFKKQIIAFYLMRFEAVYAENEENRKICWMPLQEAIRKLFYSAQKKILRQLKL
ncbi:MAG TPA: NUDIX domain-containing protein [Segetibacter sp.]|nr:NUDIX domain-containing protein [Segetibacter sp.]